MKAYKTNLKIDELNRLKDEFFSNRYQSQGSIWKQIRHACVFDAERSYNMLIALKLTPVNGCMNLLKDHNGFYYAVPNFCINDPYLEKSYLKVDKKRKAEVIQVCYIIILLIK